MKATRYIAILLILLLLGGCGGRTTTKNKGVKLSEREAYRYDKALQETKQVESLCEQVATSPSQEAFVVLLTKAKALKYDYNDEGMNVETIRHCDSLKLHIMSCQERAIQVAEGFMLQSGEINLLNLREQLFTEDAYYPVYLKKGEKLYYKIESSSTLTAKLYNADTERLIKSYQKSKITDSLTIANTGIYLLEVIPQGKLYASVSLGFRPTVSSDIYNRPAITSERVECKKGDLGGIGVPGIVMHKCFDEPRKFTLRGQLKAAFSGSSRALVAVQIPTGATDILYSMRIATSEQDRSSDGEFHENLATSYKKVKFLGLPIYEKEKNGNANLFSKLLDDNRPLRDEDAYCNMYVFRNQTQAKQFQDGTKSASVLNYDVDYSTLGTQSCNGRIPVKGLKTIYLAFENERVRYTNYLWVEVEAVVPKTEYFTTKYSIK